MGNTSNTQLMHELGSLSALVMSMREDLARTNQFFLGDGQPGALERLTRVEERMIELSETLKSITERAENTACKLAELLAASKEFKTHLDNENQHSLKIDKKTIGLFVGVFSLLWLIFEYVPFKELLTILLRLLGH